MQVLRKSDDRGNVDHGWLRSRHSFSFADYDDPDHVKFCVLRVINEDRVAPGKGFGAHGHRDMEIRSYVLEGQLRHRDSMGSGSVIVSGDMQRLSAGSGVIHREINASRTEAVHFPQIWMQPNVASIEPGYEQKHFPTRREAWPTASDRFTGWVGRVGPDPLGCTFRAPCNHHQRVYADGRRCSTSHRYIRCHAV